MSGQIVTPTADGPGSFTWRGDTATPSGGSEGIHYSIGYPITPPAPVNATAPPMTNCDVPDVLQRYPLSCVICHRRKVKCDRLVEGCENCIKAGAGCIYPQSKVSLRRARTRPSLRPMESTNRERELERKLKELEAKVYFLTNTTTRSGISQKSSNVTVEQQQEAETEQRHGNSSTRLLTGGEIATGDTVQSATATQDVSYKPITDRFWANFTGEVENIEGLLEDLSLDGQPSFDLELTSQQGFFFGYNSLMVNLYPLHPTSHQASRYWQLYVENIDPVVKILHVPSFEKNFNDAYKDLQRLEAGTEALMFSIYYSVVASLSADTVQAEFKESKDNLLKRYQFAIKQALSKAKFMKSKELAPLQALTHYLICQHQEDEDTFWTMTGLAIRLAQHLRIHRDGTIFKLSPFKVEIRRRLWWQICNLDCRAAEAHGSVSSISEDIYDAELPLNIDDIDISPDAIDPPRSKSSRTDMTFCLTGFLITRTMCRINYEPLGGQGPNKSRVKTLEDKLKMIQECRIAIKECSLHDIKSIRAIDRVSIAVFKLMVSKMWLSVYHPPYHSVTDIVPAEIKRSLLLVSLEVIEGSRRLEIEQMNRQWAWIIRSYVQWHAIAYLLAGLCQLQQYALGQEFVSRAWQQLDYIFQEPNGGNGSNSREGKLWLALTKLFNRAKTLQKDAQLSSTSDILGVSKQGDAATCRGRADKYGNPANATNGPPPQNMGSSSRMTLQYDSSTYEMMGAAREELPVPVTTTSLPPSQYQHHPLGVFSDDSPLATHHAITDSYDYPLLPIGDTNFPTMAIDGVTDANCQPNLGTASEYGGADLDWEQWNTVMCDLQFDIQ